MPKIKGGYYIKARSIKNSSIAHAPPYVREIWDYLLREANHGEQKYNGFTVKRGQLFKSYKDIREDLCWYVGYRKEKYNENHMKKGMRYLVKELMITTTKEPRGVLITICNYEYFQNPKNYERTNKEPAREPMKEPMKNHTGPSINKNGKEGKEGKEESKEIPTPSNNVPYQKIIDLYHKILPELSKVKVLTDTRKKQLKARWVSKVTNKKGETPNALSYWEGYFEHVKQVKFLLGDNDRNWTADFEWLTKEANFIKVIEGKYH